MEQTNGRGDAEHSVQNLSQLYERIARLHAAVQRLRSSVENLEAERRHLSAENRKLRQKMGGATRLENLGGSDEGFGPAGEAEKGIPLFADRLYRQLPARMSIAVFFQFAKSKRLDEKAARRCLMHLLSEGLIEQVGAYLEKSDGTGSSSRTGDGARD